MKAHIYAAMATAVIVGVISALVFAPKFVVGSAMMLFLGLICAAGIAALYAVLLAEFPDE